jgi:hypothetical protein
MNSLTALVATFLNFVVLTGVCMNKTVIVCTINFIIIVTINTVLYHRRSASDRVSLNLSAVQFIATHTFHKRLVTHA